VSLIRLVFRLLLGRRLPITSGSLQVPGLVGRVLIHRDRWGIPLIEADDPRDVPFAVGFCHGQDRAFQLELIKRVARGSLCEVVGPAALAIDRFARRVGFYHSATRQWPLLDADIRESLEAYARGATAGVTLGCPRRPHEFALLGAHPTPWTPIDTLAVTKVLSFTLCANWDVELARLKVLTEDGPEALAALDPTYPAWQPVPLPPGATAGAAVDRLAQDVADLLALVKPGGGSNNWVIAGTRTATGRPILANDPHLDASLPAHWYLAAARSPAGAIAGASFVGGPSFLVGHNGHAAWGLTAGLVDNTDLFLEQVAPDGASVRQGDGHVPCPVREEVIAVKGAPSVTERVLVTPRGPVVGPALRDAPEAISLRAVWLDNLPLRGFFAVHSVRSFAEFRVAFQDWPVASQNLVYADVTGAIGWQLAGRAPRRRKGHGTVPLPGWDTAAGWEDEPVPFEEMPHLENPPSGYIATANTRPQPEGQGPFLGVDWIDGYRLSAIQQGLEGRRDWDVAATLELQTDQKAPAWDELRPLVLTAPAADPDARQALDLLRGWDGEVRADSIPAAVYELFLAELATRVARVKAPKTFSHMLGKGLSPITLYNFFCFRRTGHLVRLLRQQPEGWLASPWPAEVADALASVVRQLRQLRGTDPDRWGWGALRPLVMHHPLSRRPGPMGQALATVFNLGPVPCGGDADTINQAAVLPLAPLAPTDNIASLRAVFDVGAWQNSRFVFPGGQSGNPFSPHYGDLFELWQKGEAVPIAFTADQMHGAAVATLSLCSPSFLPSPPRSR
jgi:penicillin amidase